MGISFRKYPKVTIKLFKSLIEPILLYASFSIRIFSSRKGELHVTWQINYANVKEFSRLLQTYITYTLFFSISNQPISNQSWTDMNAKQLEGSDEKQ